MQSPRTLPFLRRSLLQHKSFLVRRSWLEWKSWLEWRSWPELWRERRRWKCRIQNRLVSHPSMSVGESLPLVVFWLNKFHDFMRVLHRGSWNCLAALQGETPWPGAAVWAVQCLAAACPYPPFYPLSSLQDKHSLFYTCEPIPLRLLFSNKHVGGGLSWER